MEDPSREKLAKVFRNKSDESFAAAHECLINGRYRASCNRSWYSIYQAVSAGAYIKLQKNPPKERENWNHNAIEKLFKQFLCSVNLKWRYGILIQCLPPVLANRVLADYQPDEGKLGYLDAAAAIQTAENIRKVIYEVVGWESGHQLN